MKRIITEQLMAWKQSQTRKPLILKGARQVGKTYVLKAFGRDAFRQTHYVNFEEDERLEQIFQPDLSPDRILERLQLFFNNRIDRREDLIIFDEIQRCPRALTSLKYFCEDAPDVTLCAAGSLLGVLMSTDAFPVGKVSLLNLAPLSFSEFLRGIGEDMLTDELERHDIDKPFSPIAHERLWEFWKIYIVVGGMPEAVNSFRSAPLNRFDGFMAARTAQRDLIETYVADIAKHSGKLNALNVERLWRNVPVQLARALNGTSEKFKFREAIPGLRGYERLVGPLDWLAGAQLIVRVPILETIATPLSSVEKENAFKLYVADTGVLTALSRIAPDVIMTYGFGSYQGYVAENYTAQAFRVMKATPLYAWQGRTSEVEFLLETAKGVIPVEVKSGSITQSKSLSVYEQRHHPLASYVLSARNSGSVGTRHYVPLYAAEQLATQLVG